MSTKIAYISQGRLFLKDGENAPRLVMSDFAQDAIAKSVQRQQKNSWKAQGSGAIISGEALWGTKGDDTTALKIDFSGVTRGDSPDQLLYTLSTSAVGGMFCFNDTEKKERRLFHRENLWLRDLDKSPSDSSLVCSQRFTNGTACITVCNGPDVTQITEGDSMDEAPTWVPNEPKSIVYQSAGIARNASGHWAGIGPYSIQKLDLRTGDITELAADPKFDYLSPHMLANGDLLAIKRPYEPLGRRRYPLHKILLDLVLLPYRILQTIFYFFNFLSMTFAKTPLTRAGGPPVEGPDVKQVILRGRILDAEKALQKSAANTEPPSLVPPEWQLVRRNQNGVEETIATNVVAYDLSSLGSIVYTNGTTIFAVGDGGKPVVVAKESIIDTIVCLD